MGINSDPNPNPTMAMLIFRSLMVSDHANGPGPVFVPPLFPAVLDDYHQSPSPVSWRDLHLTCVAPLKTVLYRSTVAVPQTNGRELAALQQHLQMMARH